MKPRVVVMEAFGPYPKKQTVDFRELKSHQLFLITGPTGSGKTTVLDAMCYALFGVVTGAERTGSELRSDHADKHDPTKVRFDFELDGKRYRIERSPKQERPYIHGTGTTTDGAKATLREHSLTAPDKEPGSVIETGNEKVTKKVETLLGFEAGQFRQVVMIPQGEFRKLLSAPVKEREGILRTLFQTGRFLRVAEALKSRHKKVTARLDTHSVQEKTLLKKTESESSDGLEQSIAEKSAAVKRKEAEVAALKAAADTTRATHNDGEKAAERLGEVETAKTAIDTITAQKPAFDAKRAELKLAQKAAEIKPKRDFLRQREQERTDAKKKKEEAKEDLEKTQTDAKQADIRLTEEKGRDEQRSQLQQRIGELETHRGKADQLAEAQTRIQEAKKALDSAHATESACDLALSEAQEAEQRALKSLNTARITAATAPGAQRESDAAKQRLEKTALYQQQKGNLLMANEAAKEAAGKQEAAEGLVQSTRDALESLRAAWTSGQAVVLARELKEVQPCPVCGSPDHPNPASGDDGVPETTVIEQAEEKLREAEENLQSATQHASNTQAASAGLTATVDALHQDLGAAADTPLVNLQQQAQEAWRLSNEANAAVEAVSTLQSKCEATASANQKAETNRDAAQKAREGANITHENALTDHKGIARHLPEELRLPGALDAKIEETRTQLTALTNALKTASDVAQQAHLQVANTTARRDETQEGQKKATERYDDAKTEWAKTRNEQGFLDDASFSDAQREAGELQQLDHAVKEWDDARTRADERLKNAKKEAEGVAVPDMEPLKEAMEAAEAAHDAGVLQLGAQRKEVEMLSETLDELKEIANKYADDLREKRVIGRLADTANGKNGANISFERFVLAAFLEEVLQQATQRLQHMSTGRYTLHRATGIKDGRKRGGLDLDVLDAYTGRSRPVGTLSGGEGFEASLALALGMADVVQAHSGGIHLDAIFVDEGFGSLGPEDLDAVIGALEELQDGGRLVGVISHVPELAERIPARLEIDKKREGSTAAFKVP